MFFIWTNFNPLNIKNLFCQFGWNWPSGSGEEDFLNFVNVFSLFHTSLTLKNGGPFIWTNVSPYYPRIHCAKFGWNDPMILEKKIFLISSTYFRYFLIISPRKRAGPWFEQTWIPFTQGCIVSILVEFFFFNLKRRFFNFVNVLTLFHNYLPLEKGGAIHLKKNPVYPLHPRMLCVKFDRWAKNVIVYL